MSKDCLFPSPKKIIKTQKIKSPPPPAPTHLKKGIKEDKVHWQGMQVRIFSFTDWTEAEWPQRKQNTEPGIFII